jgi:hypothetical protein
MNNEIFVFGSNLAGRHGKGSALEARLNHGAKYGCGVGRQGQSYAIPTKDKNLVVLDLNVIEKYVDEFVSYAILNPDLVFNVVKVGCGLAGYKDEEMAPLFKNVPNNVKLHPDWDRILGRNYE